jgi:NADPH:quinone reductase-like Zn-dependent oxidoreductase
LFESLNMASSTCKALVARVEGDKSFMDLKNISIPKIEPHQILVRVHSVAQNPVDGKSHFPLAYLILRITDVTSVQSIDGSAFGNGAVLGCDFTGTAEKLGD